MPSNNLKKWRDARGMSREDLAEKLGVSLASISRIESGQQQPREDLLKKILVVFQMKPADFYGEFSNVSPAEIGAVRVPVLDYAQAGLFSGADLSSRIEEFSAEVILTNGDHSGMAYALVIKGDSMLPLFKEGDMVLIDPAVTPGPGDYVVAKEKGGEVAFRKYRAVGINDSGTELFELMPLNNDYASFRSDVVPVEILGTMMEHRTYRKR